MAEGLFRKFVFLVVWAYLRCNLQRSSIRASIQGSLGADIIKRRCGQRDN